MASSMLVPNPTESETLVSPALATQDDAKASGASDHESADSTESGLVPDDLEEPDTKPFITNEMKSWTRTVLASFLDMTEYTNLKIAAHNIDKISQGLERSERTKFGQKVHNRFRKHSDDFRIARHALRRAYETDLGILLQREQEFMSAEERKVALNNLYKNYDSSDEDSHSDSDENSDDLASRSTAEAPSDGPTCSVQCFTWSKFCYPLLPNSPVIKVLIGEPLTWNGQQGAKASEPYTGLTELPERISIHSPYVINVMRCFRNIEFRKFITLVRPFRTLFIFNDDIRDFYKQAIEAAQKPKDLKQDEEPSEEQKEQGESERDKKIRELLHSTTETDLKELSVLIQFMDVYLQSREDHVRSLHIRQVYFSDLTLLFKPLDVVISPSDRQAYQIVNVSIPLHRFEDPWKRNISFKRVYNFPSSNRIKTCATITCVKVDFDGTKIGPVLAEFDIPMYAASRDISSFPVYPLRFQSVLDLQLLAPPQDTSAIPFKQDVDKEFKLLKETLVCRGRTFVELARVKHMFYSGPDLTNREQIESQVVVDFEESFSVDGYHGWKPNVVSVFSSEGESLDIDNTCKGPCCSGKSLVEELSPDTTWDKYVSNTLSKHAKADAASNAQLLNIFPVKIDEVIQEMDFIEETCFLIMSYRAYGFVLKDRIWAQFDVSRLRDPQPETTKEPDAQHSEVDEDVSKSFKNLVLPDGHKDMVVSLVTQHTRNKNSDTNNEQQFDIVRGKGKGLIILLHGAPGVGKTTTAEAVAERFSKPLFQITCGDLGSNAKEVEAALKLNFGLASKWDCVLLLDEADVFLAARRREDFSRNSLVAVFLRTLEYYSGILFLTTNRIGDFDEAFKSRIHMSLYYPHLSLKSTLDIFELNFRLIESRYDQSGRSIMIDRHDIEKYIEEYYNENRESRWNGRQIRNACQTALALAEYETLPKKFRINPTGKKYIVRLQKKYLYQVAMSYLDFTKYLDTLYGADEDEYAFQRRLRVNMEKKSKGVVDIERRFMSLKTHIDKNAEPSQPSHAAPQTEGLLSPSWAADTHSSNKLHANSNQMPSSSSGTITGLPVPTTTSRATSVQASSIKEPSNASLSIHVTADVTEDLSKSVSGVSAARIDNSQLNVGQAASIRSSASRSQRFLSKLIPGKKRK